jgi:hypothetical protein
MRFAGEHYDSTVRRRERERVVANGIRCSYILYRVMCDALALFAGVLCDFALSFIPVHTSVHPKQRQRKPSAAPAYKPKTYQRFVRSGRALVSPSI